MPEPPDAAPGAKLGASGDTELFYAGPATLELYPSETGFYRDNLIDGKPQIWVALRTVPESGEVELVQATADPTEGETLMEAGADIVASVPMPPDIAAWVAAFVEEFHVERVFHKRKRDKAGPDPRKNPGAKNARRRWNMSEQDRDNFLARWAQRKAAVAKAEAAKPETETPDVAGTADPEAEPFDLASLPSLESLTADTDIRPFMNALVPESLRNAALRRVWELDPAIRDYVSPALEYAWNWNETGGAQGYGPLEAADKALQFAENLFSTGLPDESLVVSAKSDPNSQDSADASAEAEPLPDVERPGEDAAKPALAPLDGENVRISTKYGSEPNISAAGDAEPGPPARQTAYAAVHKFSARHGGATPR